MGIRIIMNKKDFKTVVQIGTTRGNKKGKKVSFKYFTKAELLGATGRTWITLIVNTVENLNKAEADKQKHMKLLAVFNAEGVMMWQRGDYGLDFRKYPLIEAKSIDL